MLMLMLMQGSSRGKKRDPGAEGLRPRVLLLLLPLQRLGLKRVDEGPSSGPLSGPPHHLTQPVQTLRLMLMLVQGSSRGKKRGPRAEGLPTGSLSPEKLLMWLLRVWSR